MIFQVLKPKSVLDEVYARKIEDLARRRRFGFTPFLPVYGGIVSKPVNVLDILGYDAYITLFSNEGFWKGLLEL